MRGIATVALQKGYSQERLATEFSRHARRSIIGSNVARHFESKEPKPETVEAYCEVLGISGDVRDAIFGLQPTPEQQRRWLEDLRRWFYLSATEFKDGSLAKIEAALDHLGDDQRGRALAAFAFANRLGSEFGEDFTETEAFVSLANALAPVLDLRGLICEKFPGVGLLTDVFVTLHGYLDEETSLALTGVVASALPLKFSDADEPIRLMWRHLERERALKEEVCKKNG
jgi:hypothetical protein